MYKDHIGGFSKDQIRDLMREYRSVIEELSTLTQAFPDPGDPGNQHYWHVHLPAPSSFLDSSEIPASIRRLYIQALIDRVQHLIDVRPASKAGVRVVAEIDFPKLSDSGVIAFFDAGYFDELFSRDLENQGWMPLPPHRTLEKEWVLSIPDRFSMRGYQEEVTDGDVRYSREIWFIGELG